MIGKPTLNVNHIASSAPTAATSTAAGPMRHDSCIHTPRVQALMSRGRPSRESPHLSATRGIRIHLLGSYPRDMQRLIDTLRERSLDELWTKAKTKETTQITEKRDSMDSQRLPLLYVYMLCFEPSK